MEKRALLVIDVQKGLAYQPGKRNNPEAESNIASLLSHWRENQWPVIHIQHDSVESGSLLRPGLPGHDFHENVQPLAGEFRFNKTVHSAFIGTSLEAHLRTENITNLVIVGLTTDHCVSTSTRMAADLGFQVTLVSDATAAFARGGLNGVLYSAEEIHTINLVSLQEEFCQVSTTKEVMAND